MNRETSPILDHTHMRLGRLRELLHERPSQALWGQLCALFQDWPPEEDLKVGLDYAQQHMLRWPDELRLMPEGWSRRLALGEPEPRGGLARLQQLWAPQVHQGEFLVEEPRPLQGACLSPLGTRLLLWTGAQRLDEGPLLEEVTLATGQRQIWMEGHEDGELQEVRYSPCGRWVAALFFAMGLRPEVRVWASGQAQAIWGAPTWPQPRRRRSWSDHCALAFSPDGQVLAYSSREAGQVSLARASTGELLSTLDAPGVQSLAWSPCGQELLLGHKQGEVSLRRVRDGHALLRLQQHVGASAVGVDASGRWWMVAGEDDQARLWERRGDQLTREATLAFDLGGLVRTYEVQATGSESLRLLNPWSSRGVEVYEMPWQLEFALDERPNFCTLNHDASALIFERQGEVWAWRLPASR